uniref:Uncharacterized protein n=1 Tax=Photinus pyralis TaxID=7054 RepID=A0A1Y1MHE2_PHOPY
MMCVRGGIFFVLLVCVFQADGAPRSVTNEDIRDAILSMVNVIRSTEDKLERHEFREKTLGDQFKRVLSNIDKRQKQLDSVRGTIGRLDQRLATVETILLQKDERERIQVQKVFDMVEQIHRSLPQLFETLKNDITSSFSSTEEKPQDAPHNAELEKLQKEIATKIDHTSSTVKNIEGQLSQIREENKNNFSGTHKFMEQYDTKLDEYNKHIDVLPTRCKQETDTQTDVILKALQNQELHIKKMQAEISGANATIRELQHKIVTIHDNLESGQKDVKDNLKELMNDSKQNYKSYGSQLGTYKEKIDAIPGTYKNETEAQTKELLKAFQTHDAGLKQLKKELNDLNTKLPEQHVKIIDKLDLLPKLTNNDNLLLNQSELVQNALKKMETKINDQLRKMGEETPKIKQEIGKALNLELPKKIDAAEGNIRKLLELQKERLTECSKHINEIPKQQKQHTDEILKVLNHELAKKFEAVLQNQRQQGDEIVKVLSREMEGATNISIESRTERNLILEALQVQRDQLQACGNQTELLKKGLFLANLGEFVLIVNVNKITPHSQFYDR